MKDPTPRQRSIEKAIEQAESVSARHLARLYLDRLRAALHTLDEPGYIDLVETLRDGEGDEAGARACQELKYPPNGGTE